jgi:hypothetical protein
MKARLFICRLQNVRLERVGCLHATRQQLENGYFCLLYRGMAQSTAGSLPIQVDRPGFPRAVRPNLASLGNVRF